MAVDSRDGVTIDRCYSCGGLWFDAQELDRCLLALYAEDSPPPEARIPERGVGTRRCPRCDRFMKTAGWTGLVLDRCPNCRGLFVEASELAQMECAQPPMDAGTFETRLHEVMISAGWTLLYAKTIALVIVRFLR
jgi:Zn-finger nucleic acid-binding protein